jgi:hypothetical protein
MAQEPRSALGLGSPIPCRHNVDRAVNLLTRHRLTHGIGNASLSLAYRHDAGGAKATAHGRIHFAPCAVTGKIQCPVILKNADGANRPILSGPKLHADSAFMTQTEPSISV